jgi:hypothetical protein
MNEATGSLYEAISMNDTVKSVLGFSQCFKKNMITRRIIKNLLPSTATIHDMTEGVFVFKVLRFWHEESVDTYVL